MKKSLYLLILFFGVSNFLDLKPIAIWLSNSSGVVGLFALYLWMAVGILLYPTSASNFSINRSEINKPIYWILLGVILSMIPAYLYHGQSIGTSIVAYRVQSFWVVAFLLLYIKPTSTDIIKALNRFSVFFILAALLRTYVVPYWFYVPDLSSEEISFFLKDSGEVMWSKGIHLLLIPLYFYTDEYQQNRSKKALFVLLLYLIALFIIQNRSSLFLAVLIVGYSFVKSIGKKGLGFAWVFIVLLLFFTWDVWIGLRDETITQLNSDDYNRVLAFNYYLFEANENWITTILGNGFLSAHSSSQMYDLMEQGIYNSDLGFIGYWNQFGLIPIMVFCIIIVKSFISKTCPFFVKAIGAHILGGSLTMSYFGDLSTILWFALYYYLYVYCSRIISYQSVFCKS